MVEMERWKSKMEDEFGELYGDMEVQVSSSTQRERSSESNEYEKEEEALVSDSEDDFRIVLNDDDCRANPTPDDPPPTKDHTQTGNHINTNYYSQHPPFKYLRSHGAAFTCIAKRSGYTSVVYFPSSSVTCDQDANGCYQQPVSSSRGTLCSAIGQTGCDFSLPWHKTITDINIDAFQQKPWKHPGVDTTDYFNFGLDEESWKHYCNSLEQLRQQTGLMSKTNKTHRAGFGRQTVGGESAQIEKRVAPVQNYAIKEGGLDIPKGRAIQVDSGTGERRPSMDIWRPRNRDSDVVIQISVHNNTECSSSSSKEELGDSDRSKLNVFENGGSGMDLTQSVFSNDSTNGHIRRQFCETDDRDGGMFLLKRYSGRDVTSDALVTDPDSKRNAEIPDTKKERISEGSFEVVNYRKEQIPSNPSVKDSFRLEPEPLLGAPFWSASSLSYSDSHDGSGSSKENTHKPARRPFPNSDIELRAPLTLECCESMESESKAGKTGLGDTNDDSRNESHLKGEQDSCSRIRLRSVAETTYHVGDGVVTQMFNGEDWFGGKSFMKNSCKRRKRQYKNNYYDGNCLPDYRETAIAFNYHYKTLAGKPVRDASTEHIRAEGCTESGTEMDTSLKGCSDEREYFVENTLTRRENRARQSDHLSQRNYTNRRLNGAIHGESACFTSDCSPIYTGTKKYRWQRKKDEEKCFRRVTEEDDIMFEHRYRDQYIDENCVRSVPYYERERKYLNKNHDRHVSYKYPYWRDRYGGSPCMDVLTDTRCKLRSWRRRVDGSFSSHREYDITSERGWHDGASLTPDMYDLRRLDGVDMGPWRQRRYKKHQNTRRFACTRRNSPDSVSVICPDDYFSNNGRGNIHQWEPLDCPEDGMHSKIKNHDSTYPHEASFSHEQHSIHGDFRIKNYVSSHCRMVFDENRLVPDRNTKVREVARDSVVNTHIISSFDLVEKDMDEQAAPRHRKSVDLHFVDLEEKVSGKFSKTGGTMSNGGKQASESSVFRERKCSESSKNVYSGKVTPLDKSKVEINASNRFVSKIEKVSDQDFETPPFKNEVILQEATGHSMKTESYVTHGKEVLLRDAVKENMTVEAFDNYRILESLAKMVKRRERFKEPIVAKELDTITKSVVTDTVVEPTESKLQQRPTRRRRWGGS